MNQIVCIIEFKDIFSIKDLFETKLKYKDQSKNFKNLGTKINMSEIFHMEYKYNLCNFKKKQQNNLLNTKEEIQGRVIILRN